MGARSATYLRDRSGRLLSTSTGGATYNYGTDRLGSTTALVSTTGTVANTYSYKPYGENNGCTGSVYNTFQYTGTHLDEPPTCTRRGTLLQVLVYAAEF